MGDYHVEWISYERAKKDVEAFGGPGYLYYGYGVWSQTGSSSP